jgi:hypothetical protein
MEGGGGFWGKMLGNKTPRICRFNNVAFNNQMAGGMQVRED